MINPAKVTDREKGKENNQEIEKLIYERKFIGHDPAGLLE